VSNRRRIDAARLRDLSGDLRQLASVRRIMLDDGAERGVRALAFSTGGGLDFWALADRTLDIGPIWWRGAPLAWQSAAGLRSPYLNDPESESGQGFNRSFSGFLVTCGLDHIRQPAGPHPLHGRLPSTPARVLGYGEDWDVDEPILFCEGEVVQARYGGENLLLRRRIEAPIGGSEIRIFDTVQNRGMGEQAHAILYHFNFGYPALQDGSVVKLADEVVLGPMSLADPAAAPSSTSHAVGGRPRALCTLSLGQPGALSIAVEFETTHLAHLQLWHDLRPNACVLGIEPCTSARAEGGRSNGDVPLKPGERRTYSLRIAMAGAAPEAPKIFQFTPGRG